MSRNRIAVVLFGKGEGAEVTSLCLKRWIRFLWKLGRDAGAHEKEQTHKSSRPEPCGFAVLCHSPTRASVENVSRCHRRHLRLLGWEEQGLGLGGWHSAWDVGTGGPGATVQLGKSTSSMGQAAIGVLHLGEEGFGGVFIHDQAILGGGSSSMSKQFWGVFHPSVLHGLGQAAGPIHANQGCQLHRSAKRVNYLTNVIFSLIAPHY